ncbi:ubiquitin carboxyl-terminal hydrolase 36 isoform X2 [Daktulosphaira vitifoliae]|uniref:ubiquitin carboxyl-terminal hydrolase 36 isoform X2 n=1 Tax=Daktulosphaira vitifoliae TaxID=58002 RepID=UPI0021AAA9A8|nr:ubiquitin carboxyl-terminal hydrolase 36 isoform X2 [Daktulosphaira vitifoliae]
MMPAASKQIGSALFQSLSNQVNGRTHHSTVTDDRSCYLYIASSRILDKTIEFEMLDHKPSMLSQMKNSCIMLLQNGCNKKDIKKSEQINGENNKVSRLPKPKVVLYPPECVQLGWQNKKMSVGSGLENPGVICYINSTLQALFHIPAFTNWLISDEQHQKKCQQKTGFQKDCIVCMVCDTFVLSQKHTGSSFKASSITSRLSLICKHLSTYRQEDAHEFLRYLIESMERCYLSVLGVVAKSLDSYSKETTPINQIFGGYIRTEVTCGKCKHISTTFQHFQDLILDIRQSDTVNDALDNYFEKEPLDESYVCERCRRQVAADKKFSIEKAPNVLCVQLKRYSVGLHGFSGNKNSKAIQINERIDLSNYQFHQQRYQNGARPLRYRLVSMVIHYGSSLNSGHYTALGLTSSGSYYYFNDSSVSQANFKNYSTSHDSYIIFYELEPSETTRISSLELKNSTITSSNGQNYKSPLFFSNKTHCNGITKAVNGISNIKAFNIKEKKLQFNDKWDTQNKMCQQGYQKDKFQAKDTIFSNNKSVTEPLTKGVTHNTLFNSLVPYIDSDKDDSDVESSLSNEDISSTIKSEKLKCVTDQKVFDKKPLISKLKDELSDQDNPTKKCLVLKPKQEDLPPNVEHNGLLSVRKCLVLKPKDDDSLDIEEGPEPVKKCFVLMPKNYNESNDTKIINSIDGKEYEKKDKHKENGFNDLSSRKSKPKVEYNGFNGVKSPSDISKTNDKKISNGNHSGEDKIRNKLLNGFNYKHSNGIKNWPKFNEFSTNSCNRNSFKESLKHRTHLGFGGEVKTWNGDKSYIDKESEQEKINGTKRSFDDEYNDDFDKGVVKKKKFDKNYYSKENGTNTLQLLHNQLNQFNGKMGRSKITWMNRSKHYRSFNNNNHYRHNGGFKKPSL